MFLMSPYYDDFYMILASSLKSLYLGSEGAGTPQQAPQPQAAHYRGGGSRAWAEAKSGGEGLVLTAA